MLHFYSDQAANCSTCIHASLIAVDDAQRRHTIIMLSEYNLKRPSPSNDNSMQIENNVDSLTSRAKTTNNPTANYPHKKYTKERKTEKKGRANFVQYQLYTFGSSLLIPPSSPLSTSVYTSSPSLFICLSNLYIIILCKIVW